MQNLDQTAWEVLNATADDWENLEQIYRMVCLEFSMEAYQRGFHYYRPTRGAPPLREVADRIRCLVEAGFLEAVMDGAGPPVRDLSDHSYVWRAWFRMTPAGRSVWESSEYTNLVEQEQTS